MNASTLAILLGLASAFVLGAGDFSGGLATKRGNVYSVVLISQIAGFGLALIAVWLLSGAIGDMAVQRVELGYSLLAGTGFALFFILIDQANETAVFWPLTAARTASVSCLAIYIAVRRIWQRPTRNQTSLVILAGLLVLR